MKNLLITFTLLFSVSVFSQENISLAGLDHEGKLCEMKLNTQGDSDMFTMNLRFENIQVTFYNKKLDLNQAVISFSSSMKKNGKGNLTEDMGSMWPDSIAKTTLNIDNGQILSLELGLHSFFHNKSYYCQF